jgi:hypothetical protein
MRLLRLWRLVMSHAPIGAYQALPEWNVSRHDIITCSPHCEYREKNAGKKFLLRYCLTLNRCYQGTGNFKKKTLCHIHNLSV